MKFPLEYATEVFINSEGGISIAQSDGSDEPAAVAFSAHRARLVAAELLRLADEAEGKTPVPVAMRDENTKEGRVNGR